MADAALKPEKAIAAIHKGTAAGLAGDGEGLPVPVQIKGDTDSRSGMDQVLQALGLRHRYNVRACLYEISQSGGRWQERNDRLFEKWRLTVMPAACLVFDSGLKPEPGQWKPLRLAAARLRAALTGHAEDHEVDPFVDWLEALPEWDGRLRNWLVECFPSLADNELARWASMSLPLAAVWRAYVPGYAVQEIPVLQGRQGSGKSTALRLLLPPDEPNWFTDNLSLEAPLKEFVEGLAGRVLVEFSEMAGTTRLDVEKLKARITTTNDNAVRLAYRRDPENLPRRCVFCGTTNSSDCLPNDPTGNRRFVMLPTTEKAADHVLHVRRYMDAANREQIWAEALASYRVGRSSMFPNDLKVRQAEVNEGFRRGNEAVEDLVETYLSKHGQRATVGDVLRYAQQNRSGVQPRQGEIVQALKNAGCVQGRDSFDGGQRRVWKRENKGAG